MRITLGGLMDAEKAAVRGMDYLPTSSASTDSPEEVYKSLSYEGANISVSEETENLPDWLEYLETDIVLISGSLFSLWENIMPRPTSVTTRETASDRLDSANPLQSVSRPTAGYSPMKVCACFTYAPKNNESRALGPLGQSGCQLETLLMVSAFLSYDPADPVSKYRGLPISFRHY
ncbi:hypothetical protein BDV34DRAFT_219861 [Aspergillus parasiticus]|uniref:Uncharacterized protein n=1 Tax=Aspergillus parasiticus TaxID=5067 RepID=A0A5N6E489_ASPPA|nr:hypothetical protein BDV34DRAFT_219861 [Aspergillus parasiticus]